MFRGEKINIDRRARRLHVALRAPRDARIQVDGHDVVPDVHAVLDAMAEFADGCARGAWTGHTGKRIRNVVNIGIGGSYLGPEMAYRALRPFSDRSMTFRFVSNVDGADFTRGDTRSRCRARRCSSSSSKTFTTLETMTNAATARDWLVRAARRDAAVAEALRRGLDQHRGGAQSSASTPANMFGFWDWVGGPLLDGFGDRPVDHDRHRPDNFRDMLAGFHAMDEHFRTAPPERNLPMLLGLLTVWYNNFFGAQTIGIMPYSAHLARFPAYLQQLQMESNGKHVDLARPRA